MSIRVLDEVLERSAASGHDLCVLVALADAAHHDGVTWLPIEAEPPTRSIMSRAHCSRAKAFTAIEALRDELRELQMVKVRRGRSFINVYRVVVGSIGELPVDVNRLPFDLPADAFSPSQPETLNREDGATADSERAADAVPAHRLSRRPSTTAAGSGSPSTKDPAQGLSEAPFTVHGEHDSPSTGDRAKRHGSAGSTDEPSKDPSEKQQQNRRPLEEADEAAAAEPPAGDTEVRDLVHALRGADADSPRRILPLALHLPRSAFLEAIETVKQRRPANPCGLLTHLLRIANAERAAAAAGELAAHRPHRPFAPAPSSPEMLKRDAPDLYVRLLAGHLDDNELEVALADYHDELAELLDLAGKVRAGDEAPAEPETPEQARARWVSRKAADPEFPLDEIAAVVQAWDDVDDVERQDLLEQAETIRGDLEQDAGKAAA
jgi:hypothetical protein